MEGSVVRSVWVGAGGWGSVSVTTLLSEQRIFREAVSAPRGLFPKLLMKTKHWRRGGARGAVIHPRSPGHVSGAQTQA